LSWKILRFLETWQDAEKGLNWFGMHKAWSAANYVGSKQRDVTADPI